MDSSGGPLPRGDGPAVSAKKLRRVMRAAYLVIVEKHQPKLAALGVHLHRLLSNKHQRRHGEHYWALTLPTCRSMDPAAAVVHPLPRDDHGGHRQKSSGLAGRASLSSLSCRSMDPAAAVYQYGWPREVQFSFKSTPVHKRRRSQRLQHGADDQERHDRPLELGCYGSATAVTRLFELMDDVEEEEDKAIDVVDFDDGELDMGTTAPVWPALSVGPAPRQVRITDSPFPVMEAEDDRLVDRRADEFITWFHEQLRTQQQQRGA